MVVRLPDVTPRQNRSARGDGSSKPLVQASAAFKMSTMPLGMKLPVLEACDDLLHATELREKGSVKYDGKEKNLQKNLSLHNTEVPSSAVQFDSTCHLLLSHLISERWQGKNDGGPDGKLVSRNSFLNVLKPDITHVELLKEVKTKEELIIRLLAHDIEHHDEYEDFDEVVLKEESCLIGSELEKSSKAKLSKKHCCSCIGSDSTKTKDSQRKLVSTQTDKDQGGNVSHFNKNTSASNTDSLMENRKHRFDGRQLNNSAIISNSLNSNENSAKCTVSNRLDFKTGSLARDSFLARRSLQNCLSESSNSHLSLYGRPQIYNQGIGKILDGRLHLPPVAVPSSSSVQKTKECSVFPGMSAALSGLFSQKNTSEIPIKDEHI